MQRLIPVGLIVAAALLLVSVPGAAGDVDCPAKSVTVPGPFGESGAATHPDCTADVWANRGIICVGPWVQHHEATVGPVHVEAWTCGSGLDPGP